MAPKNTIYDTFSIDQNPHCSDRIGSMNEPVAASRFLQIELEYPQKYHIPQGLDILQHIMAVMTAIHELTLVHDS